MLNLINNCQKLKKGEYTKVINNDKYTLSVMELADNNIISFSKNGIEYYYINILKEDTPECSSFSIKFPKENYSSVVFINTKTAMIEGSEITTSVENTNYVIREKTITAVNHKLYNSVYEINDYFIKPKFSKDKAEVYDIRDKQFKIIYNNSVLIPYSENIIQDINDLNNKLKIAVKDVFDTSSNDSLAKLSQICNVPSIDNDINISDIKVIANLYEKYKNKLNLLNSDGVLNVLNVFVYELTNDPIKAQINDFETFINNYDMSDINNLKKAQNKLKALKYNKNISKIKNKHILKYLIK